MNYIHFFLQALAVGWAVLIGAIIVNAVLNLTVWQGWYSYLESIFSNGFAEAHSAVSVANLLFLYIGYPLLLGLCALTYRLF